MEADNVLADVMTAAGNPPPEASPEAAAPEAPVAAEPTETKPEEAAAPRETSARERDESGRFAKKQAAETKPEAKAPPKLEAVKPAPPPKAPPLEESASETPETPKPSAKAPASWKPAAREHWAKLPPEVQAEVARVDGEVRKVMQEAAPARQAVQQFQQLLAPHMGMFQADGVDPLRGVGAVLQMAQTLRTGTQASKAQLVAHLIKSNGVDIQGLAQALDGSPQPQQQQAHSFDLESVLQQAEQRVYQRLQNERGAAVNQRLTQELSTFGASHEFFDDVREGMADLFQAAHRRGVQLTIEDAYNRACQLDPVISKIAQQREAAKAANAPAASTQRARDAASSVRSQPSGMAGMTPSRGGTVLDDVMQAAASAARRR